MLGASMRGDSAANGELHLLQLEAVLERLLREGVVHRLDDSRGSRRRGVARSLLRRFLRLGEAFDLCRSV